MPSPSRDRIRQLPLRERIYGVLVEQITTGEVPPGYRLRDSVLASAMGVSRTPVREALLRLEGDGFLYADHHRGFTVRGFDEREIRETYPIVWTLEVAAINEGNRRDERDLDLLDTINRKMLSPRTRRSRLALLDSEWHATLVQSGGNERLAALLTPLKRTLRRYEHAYMTSNCDLRASVAEHAEIVSALRKGRSDLAARKLETHWRRGMESVLAHRHHG